VLGIAFKSNTDDIRESAAIDLIHLLREQGADVKVFDYQAMEHGKKELGEVGISYANDPYGVAEGVDAVVIATEWQEFTELDWGKMKEHMKAPVLFDGRNLLKPERMREQGFVYYSIGRNHENS
jgi:UDPglucose 6-dehydrogenase